MTNTSIVHTIQLDLMRGYAERARATVLALLRYVSVREMADALRRVGVMFERAYWLIFGRDAVR
jgi:hypothetical protein